MYPLFSIIVPSYNSAATISRCLESVLAQSFGDYEVILADCNSADETCLIAKSLLGSRLLVSSQADRGLFDGMNRGISYSHGEWVLVLGSDDELYCPHTLDQSHHLLRQRASACRTAAYGDAFIRGSTGWAEDGDTYMGPTNLPLLIRKNICQQAIFYYGPTIRRPELQFNHYLNGNGGDNACNVRLWCLQPFVYLPMTICVFHGGGTSSFRPIQFTPVDLLTPSFWPGSAFSARQRWQAILRCWLAWKFRRLYRLFVRLTDLLRR